MAQHTHTKNESQPLSLIEHPTHSHDHGPHINMMQYNADKLEENELKDLSDLPEKRKGKQITWIDVDGIEDMTAIRILCEEFHIHDGILEQVSEITLRPKIEDYGDYMHIILRMMRYEGPKEPIYAELVHLILGRDFVLSIQEGAEGDVFNSVRERIRRDTGNIRKQGADFLVYVLLEAVIDNYFHILEEIGEVVEDLQDEMLDSPKSSLLRQVRDMKKTVRFLRKSVWPLREVISELEREDSKLIDDKNNVYFRRAYEHSIQAMDISEATRDVLSDMLDMYLSSVSNKLNQVMKALTVLSAFFLPLTFIAGVYGMNFEYMPELQWVYGYPVILGSMALIAITMLVYFKRKDWI
jgi:magnesium transporter